MSDLARYAIAVLAGLLFVAVYVAILARVFGLRLQRRPRGYGALHPAAEEDYQARKGKRL